MTKLGNAVKRILDSAETFDGIAVPCNNNVIHIVVQKKQDIT